MPMQAESLEVLEKAEVPSAQARAIVRAIELEIAGAKDTLATKHDFLALKQDLAALWHAIELLRAELRGEMTALATNLRGEMTALAATMRSEMAALASTLREEITKQRGELKAEIHATVSGVIRQLYLAVLGQTAVMLGFAYFFATYLR
jgi:hypothetical protein